MSRLNEKDLELLQTGQTVDLSTMANAYYGGEFTTNSNDYIEVLIYDTNENLLESGVVDVSDYSYTPELGVKLNTGTILRKMGYDRGKYVIKYNFLRKTAGSYETVLVKSDGSIFRGNNYHVMTNGKIMTGTTHTDSSELLFLKEYKYFVHQISPSRKEVRLAPQSINDAQYNNSFFESQLTTKKIKLTQGSSVALQADSTVLKGDSKTMKLTTGPTSQVSKQMIGGYISINNAFIKEYLPLPQATDGAQASDATEELESTLIQAQFFISNDSNATYNSGDRHFTKLFEIFKGIGDNSLPADTSIIDYPEDTPANLLGIQKLYYSKVNNPRYDWKGEDNPHTITLKSISSKPNVPTKYTWELTGWDWQTGGGWSKLKPYSASSDGDVEFIEPLAAVSSQLKVTQDSSTGSQVTIRTHSKDVNIGVKLTIEPKDGQPSTIHIPTCIRVANI